MPRGVGAFTDEEDVSALDAIQDFLPLCETEQISMMHTMTIFQTRKEKLHH